MRKLFFLFLLLAGASKVMQAQITWSFGTTSVSGLATNLPTSITSATAITQVQNSTTSVVFLTTPALGTPSVGYPGASGTFCGNAFAKTVPFAAATSTYLQVVLTPATNNSVTITAINWGNLSVATGPTTFTVFSSVDNYISPIGTATTSISTSTWGIVNVNMPAAVVGAVSTAITLRIYATGGTGTPSTTVPNWRVDDIKITAAAQTSTATVGRIPKYTGLTTFTNSIMAENNGKIGIGTTTPATTLDVNGTTTTQGFKMPTGAGDLKVLTSDGSGIGTWQAPVGGGTTLNGTGYVKMAGTTPSYVPLIPNTDLANTSVATLSGINTGDNAPNTLYSGLVTNATHTGDVSGSTALTVNGIKNADIPALTTGNLRYNGTAWVFDNTALTSFTETDPIVKAINGLVKSNGTTISSAVAGADYLTPTGSAATLSNFPTLNQSTTGNAATATTSSNISGGLVGSIPYQTAAGVTGMLAAGTTNNVLTMAANGTPIWANSPAASTTAWGLQGNAGTNSLTNFIGTTDPKPLYLRVNNDTIAKFGTQYNVAMGYQPRANGFSSTALGYYTSATGFSSTALGDLATASGVASTAIGSSTHARGEASTAMGSYTNANGFESTAMGSYTEATGMNSTAIGNNTYAIGNSSTVMGLYNFSKSYVETSLGLFNTDYTPISATSWQPTDRLFSIGNGTLYNATSNAFTILKNGNTGLGTSTPDSLLSVTKGVKFSGLYNSTNVTDSLVVVNAVGGLGKRVIPSAAASGWGLTGNAGTTAAANFIGTTDNNALTIKLNNAAYGTLNHISHNNILGVSAGASATGISHSNFFGNSAGSGAITAIGSNFLGYQAGITATTSSYSNFLGYTAGLSASSSANSNFLGYYAGRQANNSPNANFIGNSAGVAANYSPNSNFIGNNAGINANLTPYSNFIGFHAGNGANASSYSNLIGYNAGKRVVNNNIGSNNIIIGTNITLPNAATNAMNIGGVLYGTGLQNDVAATNPYETPKAGAKIGIGLVTPAYTLDVNGITNTLGLRMPTGAAAGLVLTSDDTGAATWAALPIVPNTGWGLTGNAGTNAATNFIGTSDLADLVFKTNNSEKFKISAIGKSRFYYNNWNAAGGNNIFSIGDTTFSIFDVSTTGTDAIFKFRGNNPGYNDTWSFNIEQGYNTKFNSGAYADYQSFNFAGSEKMRINQFGNVGIGTATPTTRLDIAGAIKIADGTQGINKVLTSDSNGLASWQPITTGSTTDTSLLVHKAGDETINDNKTFVNAITVNTLKIGKGGTIPTGNLYGLVIGENSLAATTGLNTNMAIGSSVMNNHTSGNYNIGIGGIALRDDSTGIGSTALGVASMKNRIGGRYNTASGYHSGSYDKYGEYNTAFGATSGGSSGFSGMTYIAGDTIRYSTFLGYAAGGKKRRGYSNIMIGGGAGYNATFGDSATYIGTEAGYNSTGSNNVFIGNRAGFNEIGSNKLYIANGRTKTLLSGDFSTNQVQINGAAIPVYTPSAAFEVKSPNNNQGAIPYPIMTDAQRLAIPNPAVGLHIYQNDGTEGIWIYKSTGWAFVGGGGTTGWGLTGNAGTNPATNFIGTTDSVPFIVKVNNNQVAKFGTNYSIAMGNATSATGDNSTATGEGTIASGYNSFAMGDVTIASGERAVSMGVETIASGVNSTAMGNATAATGVNSTSMGQGTVAKSGGSLTIGVVNDTTDTPDPLVYEQSDRIFQIGIGNYTNAMTVLRNGNTGIGSVTPTAQLHTTNTVRFEKFKNNALMDSVLTTDTSGNLKLKYFVGGTGGNDDTKWTLNNGNIYSRDSAYVGIGVDSATAKLHAKGTIRFESLKNNAAKDSVLTTDSSGNLSMKYLSADNSKWRLNANNIYSRDSAYVGIGTDSATAKFHTLGSMRFESFKNNPQGDSVLTTDQSGNLKMVYLPYGSGGGGGGATYTFKNGVTQSNGIVNIGGSLEDTVNLNLAGYAFNINNGTQKVLTASATNNNIGVGTAPVAAYRMSVNGDANIGNATSTAGIGSKLWFNGTGNGDNVWMSRYNNTANNTDLRMNIGNGAGISNDRLDIGYDSANNWNSKFVVQNNGMVGIGTTQLNGLLSVGSTHGSKLAVGNNAWAKTSVITTGNNANADGDFTDVLVAGQNNNNAVLRINSKGNVGIGTSTNTALDSAYRLSVNGKIRAKGLRVQTTGWADFVFEPGYKLKSLIEVEAFINKNKHLPEMLPAQKVIAEGNDVGETQVKLLQKVEELTLYLIDQDKQLKKLQEQNKTLETQNKEIENLKKQMDELKALLQKGK